MPDFLDRDPEETARLRAESEAAMTMEDKVFAFFDARATTVAEIEPGEPNQA